MKHVLGPQALLGHIRDRRVRTVHPRPILALGPLTILRVTLQPAVYFLGVILAITIEEALDPVDDLLLLLIGKHHEWRTLALAAKIRSSAKSLRLTNAYILKRLDHLTTPYQSQCVRRNHSQRARVEKSHRRAPNEPHHHIILYRPLSFRQWRGSRIDLRTVLLLV